MIPNFAALFQPLQLLHIGERAALFMVLVISVIILFAIRQMIIRNGLVIKTDTYAEADAQIRSIALIVRLQHV